MSSTNGEAAKADPTQFYETPGWVTRAILPHVVLPYVKCPDTIVDLGCGRGALGVELRRAFPASVITGFEVNRRRAVKASMAVYSDVHCVDLCTKRGREIAGMYRGIDLVILNPPFQRAVEFAEIAFEMVGPRGIVALLQRDAWLSCMKRLAFARKHPCNKHILPRRPSFIGTGKSDSATYAWHLFGLGLGGRWSLLDVEPLPRKSKKGSRT